MACYRDSSTFFFFFEMYNSTVACIRWIKKKKKEKRQFSCNILEICQAAFLQISCKLHTKTSLGVLWGSGYVQRSPSQSSCKHVGSHLGICHCWTMSFNFCGIKLYGIYQKILPQRAEACIIQRKVFQRAASVVTEDCLGHPTTSQITDNFWTSRCCDSREHMHITVTNVAKKHDVSCPSSVLTLGIKFVQQGCQSSLKMSTNANICEHDYSSDYWSDPVKGTAFLQQQTATEKDRWATVYLFVSVEEQSGNMRTSPRVKKFRSVPSASKVILTRFWDINRPIFEHYQDCGQRMNSAQNSAKLEKEFQPAINSKLMEIPSKGGFCIMVTLHLIWQQWLLKLSENLSFSLTKHTVQVLP
jgi:hypothetical protein